MKDAKFNPTENALNIALDIPKLIETAQKIKEEQRKDPQVQIREHAEMTLAKFSDTLTATLHRRMSACQKNLLNHLEDITYNDGLRIHWKRKDGSEGKFFVESYEVMSKCLVLLGMKRYGEILDNWAMIDQIIKALMNDTQQDRKDRGIYKYSDLVSILCEVHVCFNPHAATFDSKNFDAKNHG